MTTTELTPEAPEQVLSEIDLYLLARPLAEALGDGWSEDDDEANSSVDKSIRLQHTDGRAIGVRHLWRGRAVQTFAIGGPTPPPPAENGDQAAPDSNNRLPKGVRYSTGVRFTTASPLDEILTAIRTVLLPAFDGQRPRLHANGIRIQPVAVPDTPPAADDAPGTTGTSKATAAKSKTTARRTTSSAKRRTKPSAKPKPRPAVAAAA